MPLLTKKALQIKTNFSFKYWQKLKSFLSQRKESMKKIYMKVFAVTHLSNNETISAIADK